MGLHIATSILCFARSWLCPALWYQTWDHSVLSSPPAPSALWSLHLCGEKKRQEKHKELFDLLLLGMALPLEQTQSSCPSWYPEGKKNAKCHFLYTWPFFWFQRQIKNLLLTNV